MSDKDNDKIIDWTKDKRAHLQVLYDLAEERGDTVIVFEGHTILTAYAKYLLEYLDTIPLK